MERGNFMGISLLENAKPGAAAKAGVLLRCSLL